MRVCFRDVIVPLLSLALLGVAKGGDDAPKAGAEALEFFEAKVRPLFVERCFRCHGPEKQKGGLRLDSIEAIRKGGDSGPILKPGEPEESALIEAVVRRRRSMPPKKNFDDEEIALLVKWVRSVPPGPIRSYPRSRSPLHQATITAEQRAFWSFRPIEDPTPPIVSDTAAATTAIDRLILCRMRRRPAAEAVDGQEDIDTMRFVRLDRPASVARGS